MGFNPFRTTLPPGTVISWVFKKSPAVLLAFFVLMQAFPAYADYLQPGDFIASQDLQKFQDIGISHFSSDSTGAAQQEFGLTLPPGRGKATPKVSLVYNSQSGDMQSSYGYGWSDSLPYIERTNKHGTDKLYQYNDFYSSVDGELLPTTSTSTTSFGARTEGGSFNKYDYSNDSWLMTDKFGTTYKFGYATTTRIYDTATSTTMIYRWLLQEVRDTNGNYVTYQYYRDGNALYPYKIDYSGYSADPGIFEVEFTREARSDIATSSSMGFQVVSKYRISQIQAKINNAWVRKYDLAYTTGDNGARSLVSSITETGKDESGGTVALPATTFTYQTSTGKKGWVQFDTGVNYLPSFTKYDIDNGVRLADLNGDGLTDLAQAAYNNHPITGSIWSERVTKLGNTTSDWATSTALEIPSDIYFTYNNADGGSRLADVNGDGFIDILSARHVSGSDPTYPVGFSFNKTYINTGSSWVASTTWNSPVAFTGSSIYEGSAYAPNIIDINGDGLTDIISAAQGTTSRAWMNNGAGWTLNTNTWGTFIPDMYLDGSKETVGIPQMIDVNGDHLPDVIKAVTFCHNDGFGNITCDSPTSAVYLNNGNGWNASSTPWTVPFSFHEVRLGPQNQIENVRDLGVRFDDLNGDGLVDAIRSSGDVGSCGDCTVFINTGSGWTEDTDWDPSVHFIDYLDPLIFGYKQRDTSVRLIDIDGDGLSEILDGGTRYLPNNAGYKADLLSRTITAKGARTTYTYKGSPSYVTGTSTVLNNIPFSLNTLYKSETYDGFAATTSLTYSYGGGQFYFLNPFDRRLAGFATTTETDAVGNYKTTYLHQGNGSQTGIGETSDAYSKIGKPYRKEARDSSGNLFDLIITAWNSTSLGNSRFFSAPTQAVSYTYDGDSDHKDSAESYSYDSYGNLSVKTQWGEVTGSTDGTFSDIGSDKRIATTTYAASTTPYILGLASQEIVSDQSGTKVLETKHYYDSLSTGNVDKGNETKTEQWKTSSTYLPTLRAFNAYGLVASTTDPRGNVTTFTYEPNNLYIATSTNALSQQTQFYYDYSLGKPKQTIDPNTRVFETTFDGLDRPTAEKQPDISSPASLVTKKAYTYTDTIGSRKILETNYLDGSTDFTVYRYLDGLDRIVQARKEAEDTNKFSTKDFIYNSLGLLDQESLPYFSTNSSRTTATSTSALFTHYTYDAVKRMSAIGTAVGTTSMAYDDWTATTTDALGNIKGFSYDAYKRLARVTERDDANTYITQYTYDAADNLTKVTDADANLRNFTYDGLKRRLTAEDLHDSGDGTFGSWSYVFDDAGNLASTTDPKSQQVDYTYDALNRPLTEDYTGAGGTEVSYLYDTCSEGVGRLCIATSTGAVSTFTYNALGLPASEAKTIATTTYTTSYSYDWQGNVTNLVYPDNSEVKYTYNTAGQLETIQQKESGGSFTDLVSDFDYGPHEKAVFKSFANGVKSNYTYDTSQLYRLKTIYTVASSTYSGTGGGFALLNNPWKNFASGLEEFPLAFARFFTQLAQVDTDVSFQDATTTEDAPQKTATSSDGVQIDTPSDTATTSETASTTPESIDSLSDLLKIASSTPITDDLASTTEQTAVEEVKPLSEVFKVSLTPAIVGSGDSAVEILKDKPEVRLKKWNGEAEIAVSYDGVTGDTADPAVSGKAEWGSGTKEVHAYELPAKEGMEGGGFEIEVVLNQKPDTNVFNFNVRGAENLDFLYQAPLNEEQQEEGVMCTETQCTDKEGNIVTERPENVVGSYAVYHKENRDYVDGEKNYATGKAFHIFRPKAHDASGKEVWGTLIYEDGSLKVQIPQEFLDSATYPVVVDPTFGFGSVGGSSAVMNQDAAYAISNSLTEGNASISKLSLYGRVFSDGTRNFKGLIYDNNSSYPNNLLGATATTSLTNTAAGWQDLTFSVPISIQNSGSYWLGFVADSGSPYAVYYYDSSTTTTRYARPHLSGDFSNTPSPYTAGASNLGRKVSLYATYATTTTPTTANTHSIDFEKDSTQYAYVNDSTPLSITGNYTVEAWIKLESLPTSGGVYPIAEKNEAGSNRSTNFLVQDGGGTTYLTFGVDETGNNSDTSTIDYAWTPSLGVWYHVAGVFTASTNTAQLYINGSSVGSSSGTASAIYDGNAATYIGKQGSTSRYFDGKIDDVRIWNTARTSGQINDNKSTELTGSESGLVGYWRVNNNVDDTTANNNDLTLSGSPSYSTDVPFSGMGSAPSAPSSLETQGQTDPANLSTQTPNFTAIYNDADTTDIATYYQLQVSATSTFATTVWDSTKTILSSSTPQGTRTPSITYSGTSLTASSTYYWRVKLWDTADNEGAWSTATSTFSIAAQEGVYSNTHSLDLEYDSGQYGSRADTATLSITGALTLQAWVKVESFTGAGVMPIISKSNGSINSGGYQMALEDRGSGVWRLGLQISSGGGNITYTFSNTDWNASGFTGQWKHVAAVWDGNGAHAPTIYINGSSDGSAESGTSAASLADDNEDTNVGHQNGASRYFDGKIDDARIYNTARSSGDISGDYNDEVAGSSANLVAYWRFNNNANDTSPYVNTLTLSGSPTYSTDVPFVGDSLNFDGIQNLSYVYDAVGNILTINDLSETIGGRTESFTYDDLYRLTSAATSYATSTPYSDTYTYDKLGNITSKTGVGSYTYAGDTGSLYANPHAPTSINGLAVAYDRNGNLTNYASTTNTWDYRNRLIASYASSSPSTFYTFDDTMQRVTVGNGSATTTYASKMFNISSATTTKHVFAPNGELVAIIIGSGATTTREFAHLDHLGGVAAITNASGTPISVTSFYPYGSDRVSSGIQDQRVFIGGEKDASTNNYYLINRFYNPTVGQFLSQDPMFWRNLNLADPQSQNSYSYANGNPINKKDPDGLKAISIGSIIDGIKKVLSGIFGGGSASASNTTPPSVGKTVPLPGGWQSQGQDKTGCFDSCTTMAGYVPTEKNRIITSSLVDGKPQTESGAKQGVQTIDSYLSNNSPIIVGVNWNNGTEPANVGHEQTQHFVTIYGYNFDSKGNKYYLFADPGTRWEEKGMSPNNRLYLNTDNSLRGTSVYNQNSKTYTVTEVRPK